MRKSVLIILLLATITAKAQKGSVSGLLFDTLASRPVPDATVTLLLEKDSSLVSFTMTDNAGRFNIGSVAPGAYRLQLSHVSYHTDEKKLLISEKGERVDMGRLVMNDRTQVLTGVTVRSEGPPVTLIGDTVQYNAGSFKTQPNANVEQLLKKLPGVQVEKDGTVKAQGQKVNRVLVDGKEFFGTDPKMATKNLPADAIDKVQVYDKQSDQAALTGFDDGNSEKTINLKLKKDKKKGAFGKAMAAGGTDDRYEGRFNVNSFKGARQFSAIGMANNTNAEGFSFMDMMSFTGELNRMMRGGNGNINLNINSDDPALAGLGNNTNGIRTIAGGGLNYNNLLGTRTELTSNYFFNRYNPFTDSRVQRTYLLPDSSYQYNQHAVNDNVSNTHRLNLGLDYQIDSFHSVKLNSSVGYQQSNSSSLSDYEQRGENGQLSNTGFNNSFNKNDGFNVRNDLLLRKKFRKRGRTLSLSVQTSVNQTSGKGTLESVNRFFNGGSNPYRNDSIEQRINTEGRMNSYSARLVYTEPIFRKSLLEFSIGRNFTDNYSEKRTYDYNKSSGNYSDLNDELSNEFKNGYGYTNGGLRFRTQKKKYNFAVGANVQRAELDGKVLAGTKDTVLRKTFTNVLPTARFQYYFSRQKNLTVNYSGYTTQPTISQLQPVADISNPLFIKEGNPDLKQEYTQALQLNYSGVNPFRNKNLFLFANFSRTDNKIVNNDSVFANGVRKSRPVNVDGVYNLNTDISVGVPVRPLKGSLRVGSSLGYQRGIQFVNMQKNTINAASAGPRLSLDMEPHKNFDCSIGAGISYNRTTYSLQPAFNTNYITQNYEAEFNWQLPADFQLSSSMLYTVNNQLAEGFNKGVPLWNASVSKQFLRFKRGELKFSVNDILNENLGIRRTSNQNYIEDSRTNSLRRYCLLSFTYSLTKMAAQTGGGGLNIIRR